jgi:hypothetical protein
MTQVTLFDALASEQGKTQGMKAAADGNRELLEEARMIAYQIAYCHGTVHADAVVAELVRRGYPPQALGNAAGSLFKGKKWEHTGGYHKSARPWAHSNDLKIWKLRTNQ